ncbi:recombinase family protein [uncultured Maribacter sp.]|uniref:recombinase family protein n=1 Tax=uncultured Maribacter sp. TaxID=431308 RepID=UPI0026204F96|nr:recombinase family protein [uncultured Maribacter sp.]
MRARYYRVDSITSKTKKELEKKYKTEELFIDVCSSSIPFKERLRSKELLNFLNTLEGFKIDYISVNSLDEFGKNIHDILSTITVFNQLGLTIKIDNLKIESLVKGKPNETFVLLVNALTNIADMEKKTMLDLQKKGIAKAKAKGVYKGRIKGSVEPKEVVLKKYNKVIKVLSTGKSLRETAKICKVSLGTVQKVKKLL